MPKNADIQCFFGLIASVVFHTSVMMKEQIIAAAITLQRRKILTQSGTNCYPLSVSFDKPSVFLVCLPFSHPTPTPAQAVVLFLVWLQPQGGGHEDQRGGTQTGSCHQFS